MEEQKRKHIETAKRVWESYMNGTNKNQIAKMLQINRAEVVHIIKYTTQTLYLDTESLRENLDRTTEKNTALLQKVEDLKNLSHSNIDAYYKGKKTNEKLSYKRLYEIYLDRWEEAQEALEECYSAKLSIFGKKLI